MADAREPSEVSLLASADELDPEVFPALRNVSAAMIFEFVPIPKVRTTPEFVYVPVARRDEFHILAVIAEWSFAWESGVLRHEAFKAKAARRPDYGYEWLERFPAGHDFRLVPLFGRSRYFGYSLLHHLLPRKTLERFGLPLLKPGLWPFEWPTSRRDPLLPLDAETRLACAVQYHLWPLLCPGATPSAFSANEPIRTLSHNLDFWLPYADLVAQDRMRRHGRVRIENKRQATLLRKLQRDAPPEFTPERPLFGGYVWCGEGEAHEATRAIVEMADRRGRLRAILDAVRSHRLEDDFSAKWSFAKEDFERKLHRKRSKVKVTFVELPDTIPIHGPDVEVDENLLWQDFFGILSPKERRIVICLRSGTTQVSEIGKMLGYANHSPVSKALSRIRRKAREFLDN